MFVLCVIGVGIAAGIGIGVVGGSGGGGKTREKRLELGTPGGGNSGVVTLLLFLECGADMNGVAVKHLQEWAWRGVRGRRRGRDVDHFCFCFVFQCDLVVADK